MSKGKTFFLLLRAEKPHAGSFSEHPWFISFVMQNVS